MQNQYPFLFITFCSCIYRDQEKDNETKSKKVSLWDALNHKPEKKDLSCSSSAHGSFQFLSFHLNWEESRLLLLYVHDFHFYVPRLEAFRIGERERECGITKRSLGSIHERL